VAERVLPYEVPELGYAAVESRSLDRMRANWEDWWGDQTPLANCVRCGRYTEDLNRDSAGDPMHQDPEDDREPRCEDCAKEAFGEALEKDLLDFLEDKPGVAERYRDALKSFIETNRYDALLETAGRLRADGQHEAAIAMAQTACEVCTETMLQALFRINGITYLVEPVGNLLPSYNLANERVRKLYMAISGDPIQDESFWNAFKLHTKRRHEVVHGGRGAEPWESEESVEAVSAVVAHLLKRWR
jgi:hypothetical protein